MRWSTERILLAERLPFVAVLAQLSRAWAGVCRHVWREPICFRIYVDWRRAIRSGILMGPRTPKPSNADAGVAPRSDL